MDILNMIFLVSCESVLTGGWKNLIYGQVAIMVMFRRKRGQRFGLALFAGKSIY